MLANGIAIGHPGDIIGNGAGAILSSHALKLQRIISDLFGIFMADNRLLPPQFQSMAGQDCARAVADYIAGMTDRYAIREHRRIFAVEEVPE